MSKRAKIVIAIPVYLILIMVAAFLPDYWRGVVNTLLTILMIYFIDNIHVNEKCSREDYPYMRQKKLSKIKIADEWYNVELEELGFNNKATRICRLIDKVMFMADPFAFFRVKFEDGNVYECYLSDSGRYVIEARWHKVEQKSNTKKDKTRTIR